MRHHEFTVGEHPAAFHDFLVIDVEWSRLPDIVDGLSAQFIDGHAARVDIAAGSLCAVDFGEEFGKILRCHIHMGGARFIFICRQRHVHISGTSREEADERQEKQEEFASHTIF